MIEPNTIDARPLVWEPMPKDSCLPTNTRKSVSAHHRDPITPLSVASWCTACSSTSRGRGLLSTTLPTDDIFDRGFTFAEFSELRPFATRGIELVIGGCHLLKRNIAGVGECGCEPTQQGNAFDHFH